MLPLSTIDNATAELRDLKQNQFVTLIMLAEGRPTEVGNARLLMNWRRLSTFSMVPHCLVAKAITQLTIRTQQSTWRTLKSVICTFSQSQRTLRIYSAIWSPPVCRSAPVESQFPEMAKHGHRAGKAGLMWTRLVLIWWCVWPPSQAMCTGPNRKLLSQLTSVEEVPTIPDRWKLLITRPLRRSTKLSL